MACAVTREQTNEKHAQASAIVAALGVAFGVTACGSDTQPRALPTATPTASASLPPAPTSPATPTQAPAAQGSFKARATDAALKSDLKFMATIEESYITDHPNEMGYPVPATRSDGHASDIGGNRLPFRPGNVIAVKVGPAGYCISRYNKAGAKANSATKSFVYKSDQAGMQTAVGAC